MARSLNKVMLIGNLTRDPEMRYTPAGTAVCTFSVATNRNWTTDTGEKKEDVEFHNVVAWNKLAEICSELLKKGRKVYVEGRLATRSWQGQDGAQKQRTEVVISDMVILDKKEGGSEMADMGVEAQVSPEEVEEKPAKKGNKQSLPSDGKKSEKTEKVEEPKEEVNEEDIPF
jgi:single-strand DNA-binding protein